MADFFQKITFSGKIAFLQKSAHFVTRLQKLFLNLKAPQTRMQINVENFFVVHVVPEIYAKNTNFKSSQMCFFCYSVQTSLSNLPFKAFYMNYIYKTKLQKQTFALYKYLVLFLAQFISLFPTKDKTFCTTFAHLAQKNRKIKMFSIKILSVTG